MGYKGEDVITSILNIFGPGVTFVKPELFYFIIAIFAVIIATYIYYSLPGHVAEVRKLPFVDFISEQAQSASERGRPLMIASTREATGGVAVLNAFMTITKYSANRAAEMQVPLHGMSNNLRTYLMMADYARQGAIEGGHPEIFKDQNFYYVDPSGFVVEGVKLVQREKPGASLFLGAGAVSYSTMIEMAARQGSLNFGSSDDGWSTCFLAATCDYNTFSDEMVAGATYITKDAKQAATLVGMDLIKLFTLGAVIVLLVKGLLRW